MAGAQPVTDAFVSLEEGGGSEFGPWIELLSDAKNRKGLVRLTVEAFHGRAAWKEIAELPGCVQEDGKSVTAPTDVAHFNAATLARSAFQLAQRYWRREAIERFRLVCWNCTKKGGEGHRGDMRALAIGKDGALDLGSLAGDATNVTLKILAEQNKELREMVKELLGSQVQMAQANAGTMLTSLEVNKVVAQERLELAERAAKQNTRATPADWNVRWDSTMRHLGKPLSLLAEFLKPPPGFRWGASDGGHFGGASPGAPNGGPSSSTSSSSSAPDDSQRQAQAFLDTLSGEQCDQLRDGLGAQCWSTICAVIRGDAADWLNERDALGVILRSNVALLMRVLTPEQIVTLRGFAE